MTLKYEMLFGLPVVKDKINPKKYNKKEIIKDIEYNYKISKQRGDTFFGKWHDSYECVDKKFKKVKTESLVDIYIEKFKNFSLNFLHIKQDHSIRVDIINYTCNRDDAYMQVHNHPGADFALIHYLQVPKNAAPIEFKNQNDFSYYFRYLRPDLFKLTKERNPVNSWMFNYYPMTPAEDSILIFPSIMLHQVPYSKVLTKNSRISVVANVTIRKVN